MEGLLCYGVRPVKYYGKDGYIWHRHRRWFQDFMKQLFLCLTKYHTMKHISLWIKHHILGDWI